MLLIAVSLSTFVPVRCIAATPVSQTDGADGRLRPLVVVLGFEGSMLVDEGTGRRVWGSFVGDYAHPAHPKGMRAIALPMQPNTPLRSLRDAVTPDRPLDRFRFKLLRLIPVHATGYRPLLRMLRGEGYRFAPAGAPPDTARCYNAFVFLYDWRRDNAESAALLYRFIQEKRRYLLQRDGECGVAPDADGVLRFDVVAHSMGALPVNYFLRYGDVPLPDADVLPPVTWKGAREVDDVVLIAPPNAGSLDALEALVEGRRYLRGTGRYEPAVLGTMPALYQLLPQHGGGAVVLADDTAHAVGDLFDPATWEHLGWGLADPLQDDVLKILLPDVHSPTARRRIALDHLAKSLRRARRFAQALDAPAGKAPSHLDVHVLAGDDRPTDAVAAWDASDHRFQIVERREGDGRVLRSSAVDVPEMEAPRNGKDTRVAFVDGRHVGMMRRPAFADALSRSLDDSSSAGNRLRGKTHLRSAVWLSTAHFRPVQQEDLLLPTSDDEGRAIALSFMMSWSRRTYAGLSFAVAGSAAPGAAELARLLPVSSGDGLHGGTVRYYEASLVAEHRLPLWHRLQPFFRLSPGIAWATQDEVWLERQAAPSSPIRPEIAETAFILPLGLGVALPLRSRLHLTLLTQADLAGLVRRSSERLFDMPWHLGLRYDLRP